MGVWQRTTVRWRSIRCVGRAWRTDSENTWHGGASLELYFFSRASAPSAHGISFCGERTSPSSAPGPNATAGNLPASTRALPERTVAATHLRAEVSTDGC